MTQKFKALTLLITCLVASLFVWLLTLTGVIGKQETWRIIFSSLGLAGILYLTIWFGKNLYKKTQPSKSEYLYSTEKYTMPLLIASINKDVSILHFYFYCIACVTCDQFKSSSSNPSSQNKTLQEILFIQFVSSSSSSSEMRLLLLSTPIGSVPQALVQWQIVHKSNIRSLSKVLLCLISSLRTFKHSIRLLNAGSFNPLNGLKEGRNPLVHLSEYMSECRPL